MSASVISAQLPDQADLPESGLQQKYAGSIQRPTQSTRPIRVLAQPAFVLHSYPYKETSLIIDVFTRQYGRIALVAKGAKRPHSQLRGALQTFQPLTISWSGKSELQTLTAAEWVGGMPPLEKNALLCGFYMNEIIIKLLQRDDPQPLLFDEYVTTMNQLAHVEPVPIVLRKFEMNLLKMAGVLNDLSFCVQQRRRVSPALLYIVDPESGTRPAQENEAGIKVHGKTLIDMQSADYSDATTQSQSKLLMRALLAHHLHGSPVHTRQILVDLQNL
jgi:DNA repair protein RecO (recombination protein O)